MKCPKCQFNNPGEMSFCGKCGQNLACNAGTLVQATSFQEKLERLQRYLPEGLTEKILAQKNKLEGERKLVTIMFCDMKDFTPLAEKLGPEKTFALMDDVYEILIRKVHQFQGTVNELRGDGILALFGAPIAIENAPHCAVRASIAIHQEIGRFNSRRWNRIDDLPSIQLRIGINTGPVVLGTVGNDLRVSFVLAGDTINMAARMEGIAEPGATYVTENTFRATKGLFQYEALGRKAVKGKAKAMTIYKVLSAKKGVYRPRLGSERLIFSKMVGRDKQLDELQLQVLEAVNGQGSVVNIIGEAGIGKSRLVAELKNQRVMKRAVLLEGRAISIGQNLSFHPIIDLLRRWAQINEEDGEASTLGKLETALRDVIPEDYHEILPFVATLMGMKLSGRYADRIQGIEGEPLEKLILKNVRDLLIKAAKTVPLVIVMEDLHWADTSSIELLESLLRLAESHRIVFVNVFRSGYEETGDRIIEAIRKNIPDHYVEIFLESLSERMSEAIIMNMLKTRGLHRSITRQIIERTGGNPFFIEEVVRSLIDQRAVILNKNRTFQVAKELGAITIPNTVNEVLMARIDRLDDDSRKLIRIASVIGRSFFQRILSEVAGPVDDMEEKLSQLKEIQLIRERKRMGEVEFSFEHALIQEVAYESIIPTKGRDLHRKVATAIEVVFRQRLHEFYGMLAYHYGRAEDREKTEEYLIKAGEEALRTAASDEALHYYKEALHLYLKKSGKDADPEKVAMLEKNIALALYNRGQHDEAVGYFERALEHYWGQLPKNPLTRTVALLSSFLHLITALFIPSFKFRKTPTQQDIQVFDLFYKKCKALAITNPKQFFIEFFFFHKYITAFDLRKLENGAALFVSASPLFSFSGISFGLSGKLLDSVRPMISRDDVRASSIYEVCETMHHFLEGSWKELKHYDDDIVNKTCEIGEIWDATQILYWHAIPCIYQGSFDITESILAKLDNIFEVFQYDLAKSYAHELKSCLLVECRRYDDALNEIREGVQFEETAGQGFWDLYVCEARIYISMGEIGKAEKCLEQANVICKKIRPVPFQMTGLYRVELEYNLYQLKEMLSDGEQTKLDEYRRRSIRSIKQFLNNAKKVARYRVDSYRMTGDFFWLMNKPEKALRWWIRAIREGERLGARFQLAVVYFELGKRLVDPRNKYRHLDGSMGKDYLEKARSMFEEMYIPFYLDELNQRYNC